MIRQGGMKQAARGWLNRTDATGNGILNESKSTRDDPFQMTDRGWKDSCYQKEEIIFPIPFP